MILFGHPTGNPNSHHAALANYEAGRLEAFCVPWFPGALTLDLFSKVSGAKAEAARLRRRRFKPLAAAPKIQGRIGPDLHAPLRALFGGAARLLADQPSMASCLRFVFVGTSYSPAGQGERQVGQLAKAAGCAALVTDEPDRRSYFEVLKATKEADCALVLGSREAVYTTSKALGTLAAAKTVLAIVHEKSLVCQLYRSHPKVLVCSFSSSPDEPACMAQIAHSLERLCGVERPAGEAFFVPVEYGARAMTATLCQIFDSAVADRK